MLDDLKLLKTVIRSTPLISIDLIVKKDNKNPIRKAYK